jgi:hypothetical protein
MATYIRLKAKAISSWLQYYSIFPGERFQRSTSSDLSKLALTKAGL